MKYDVCVFGGCSLDQTFFQNMDGSYDERPNSIAPGGKGANQAVAASRAGAKTTIITRIGKDNIGETILENLKFNLVDTSNVDIVEGLQNDYANIYINIKDKDNDIQRVSGAINSFTVDMIEKYKDALLNSKIIVCQLKVPKEVTEELINFCHENDKILILTPCRPEKLSINEEKNLELIDKISIITCNRKECQTIFGTDDIESCVKKYPNKLIVTLGSEGLMYFNGERIIKMPAIETDVIDTTGAGDTLNGNLSAFLSEGLDLQHALRKAMYASTMKLTTKTAQQGMPYRDDLEEFILSKRNDKFEYQKELALALEMVQEAYYKIRYNSNIKIHSKIDTTLVTDADLMVEKYLLSEITKKFPNDKFVTEENYPNNQLSDRTWVIDPIDGTAHFIKKDGLWGIQLAFFDKGTTKFSVIYLPEKDELYYAAENFGAYLNNNMIIPNEPVPVNQAIIEFGGSIYRETEIKRGCLQNLIRDGHLAVSNIMHINSSCIAYTNLVSEKTDALITSTVKPWDVMPGELLCKECGIPIKYMDENKRVKMFTLNQKVIDVCFPEKAKEQDER